MFKVLHVTLYKLTVLSYFYIKAINYLNFILIMSSRYSFTHIYIVLYYYLTLNYVKYNAFFLRQHSLPALRLAQLSKTQVEFPNSNLHSDRNFFKSNFFSLPSYFLRNLKKNNKYTIVRSKSEFSDELINEFFDKIGTSFSSDLSEISNAYEYTYSREKNPVEKLKLKDQWYELNQKWLQQSLSNFKKSKSLSLSSVFARNKPKLSQGTLSEFSDKFLSITDWPESTKVHILKTNAKINPIKKWTLSHIIEGGIFQRSNLSRTCSILSYMLPILILGGIIPKLSATSIALSTAITAGLISNRDAGAPKKDLHGKLINPPANIQTILLTSVILGIHGAIGAASSNFLLKNVDFSQFLSEEGINSVMINLQFIFAALNYKTYIASSN